MTEAYRYGERPRYKYSFSNSKGGTFETDSYKNRMWRIKTSLHTWVDYFNPERTKGYDCVMLTLTYAESSRWQPKHITELLSYVKRTLKESILTYAWVAELQANGQMHYHILYYVKLGVKIAFVDQENEKNFIAWKHGMSKIETAKKRGLYLASYASKEYQKDFSRFPKGARASGMWVNAKLANKEEFKQIKAYAMAPHFIKEAVKKHSEPEKINYEYFARFTKTKGFIVTENGECLADLNEPELAKYGVIRTHKGKLRILINEDFIEYDYQKEFIKVKYVPLGYLERIGLFRVQGTWHFDGEPIDSGIQLLSIVSCSGRTWVDELKEKAMKNQQGKKDGK